MSLSNQPRFVRRGQSIRADDINQFSRILSQSPDGLATNPQMFARNLGTYGRCENVGDTRLDPMDIATIKGQTYEEPINAPGDIPAIILQVGIAEAGDDLSKIVIVHEQIESGVSHLGYACLMGICWAKYDGTSGNRGSVAAGSTALTLSASGPAEILWTDGIDLALVRFPTSGASGGEQIAHSHTTADWGFVPSWFGG